MIERIDGLPQYEKVVISEKAPMDQSYIFVLFYTKFPPEQFQHSMQYLEKHHLTYRRFGKYHIRTIQWEKDKYLKKTLLVGTPHEFPQDTKPLHTIYYKDGSEAMKFVDPAQIKKGNSL